MTNTKPTEIKVLCEYCKDLVSATVRASSEVLMDCDSCGTERGIRVSIECDLCHHPLIEMEDRDFSDFKIDNKGGKKYI